MKKLVIILIAFMLAYPGFTQEDDKKEKKKFKIKKPELNIREGVGNLVGNVLTGKTEVLDGIIAKVNYVNGVYSPEIKTTEMKYFPDYTKEGDHIVSVSFFKGDGIGLVEVKGDVTVNGEPTDYLGLGSFARHYTQKPEGPVTLNIKTVGGDEASFTLNPIPGIEILSVNGETALPILDLDENIELEYYNPEGSEGSTVRVSMLTKIMGVSTLNHFADFKVKEAGVVKVTIPKEALANPEYAAGTALDIGNFNKGNNFLIVEREVKTSKEEYGSDQNPGKLQASELFTRNFASFPIIVKGKQDEGLVANIRVQGRTEDKVYGYDFHKPNANSGIPFSRASKFGLVSLTIQAKTWRQETETTSHSWTVGNTRYTQTTTTTTTFEFPQLPEEQWQYVLDRIYQDLIVFFKEMNIEFVPVEQVTGAADYNKLFDINNEVTQEEANISYKNTLRFTPQGIGEILRSVNSNFTSDNPTVNIMKQAGEIDGLVAVNIELGVTANKAGNIILIPTMNVMVHGRDELKDDKQGKYFEGMVRGTTGEPYNEALLRANYDELLRVCSIQPMMQVMKSALTTIKAKEEQLGFDKIWSIGEESTEE